MISEIRKAYEDSFWMLEDGIRKISDDQWRQGPDDYLVPARIAYHIMKSFEWLTNELPREEFMPIRIYKLDWLGPVEPMPGRAELLTGITLMRANVLDWLEKIEKQSSAGLESQERVRKALYYLRHIQHHIGEYSIIARLIHCDSPEWK